MATAGSTRRTFPAPRAAVQALLEETVATRRHLHRHAELSTEEHETQRFILDKLEALGLED
ncbi:MAG: amidohydrolase, partial [Chloroflexi bacterium]|nr:amidohydrolase [Chloroflexota bacterium]